MATPEQPKSHLDSIIDRGLGTFLQLNGAQDLRAALHGDFLAILATAWEIPPASLNSIINNRIEELYAREARAQDNLAGNYDVAAETGEGWIMRGDQGESIAFIPSDAYM